ncbi:DUF2442 domain-containing protein [Anaerosinus massiliensis]|uniref:DUF2442 domain-containing protein n=1 Tax=Massilibacillus massiliensis TaxID=1806837 RepID=UPI000DA6177A|nr:DUF2442 domain-containing protein [Massilibacillus massiliensis]
MLSIKVLSVVPLKDMYLLVFFENGVVKKFDVKPIIKDFPEFETLKNVDLFNLVNVETGGYGVSWNEDLDCSEGELWENGVEIPLSLSDFVSFTKYNVVNTKEASEILSCSRQNIEASIKRGRISPIKEYQKTKLFVKPDILKLSK